MLRTTNKTRILGIFALVGLLGLSACARKDGGAPVQWGRSYDQAPQYTRYSNTPQQYNTAPKQASYTSPDMSRQPVTKNLPYQIEVRPGENLYQIAKAHGTTVDELADYNGLDYPYNVRAGQVLGIPNTNIHVVQRGDTIYSISRRYRLETWELADLNDIKWPYTIAVGQELRVTNAIPKKRVKPDYRVERSVPVPPAPKPQPASYQSVTRAPLPAAKPASYRPAQNTPPAPPAMTKDNGFIWPIEGRVLSTYGPKRNGQHNDGINISAWKGQPVRASKSGRVTYVGNELRNYGNLILIKHEDGFVTAYAHNSRMKVREGQWVNQGQVIAEAGDSGDVKNTQVHFEIRKGRKSVNPQQFL